LRPHRGILEYTEPRHGMSLVDPNSLTRDRYLPANPSVATVLLQEC